jgi:uncharacterized protein YbbC (DUF1343 family)
MPGVRFVPIRFTPKERQFTGKECGGVQITVTDRARFDPVRLGIALAVVLRAQYRKEWQPEGFLKMLADRAAYQAVLDGKSVDEVMAVWEPELNEFRAVRAKYLLYDVRERADSR